MKLKICIGKIDVVLVWFGVMLVQFGAALVRFGVVLVRSGVVLVRFGVGKVWSCVGKVWCCVGEFLQREVLVEVLYLSHLRTKFQEDKMRSRLFFFSSPNFLILL